MAAALIALATPATAVAHADLRSSEPSGQTRLASPPPSVRVALEAPVEEEFLELAVTGPSGAQLARGARRDPADPSAIVAQVLPDGAGDYVVGWRVLSRDGHASRDGYVLGVGVGAPQRAAAPDRTGDAGPLQVIARLLALVGPMGLLGLAVVRFAIVGPAWRAGGVVPPGPGEPAVAVREAGGPALRAAARGWWAAWWSFVAAAAVGVILLPVALLRALGEGVGDLGTLLSDTRAGAAVVVQAAALVASAAAAAALAGSDSANAPGARLGRGGALALGPTVGLVAISWAGHASSGNDPVLGIAIDAVHTLGSAAWLGGLVGLAALVPAAADRLRDPERVRLAAGVVVRFSALAVAAVAIVTLSGVYRALVELGSLDDLLDTAYGRALAVKLGLFALLLFGGAFNRFVVHPRLERAALGLAGDDRGALRALRVSVRAELALAAALMVAVAVLLSLPPPA